MGVVHSHQMQQTLFLSLATSSPSQVFHRSLLKATRTKCSALQKKQNHQPTAHSPHSIPQTNHPMATRAHVQQLKALIDTPRPNTKASTVIEAQLSNLHGLSLGVLTAGVEHAMLRCRESVEKYNTALQTNLTGEVFKA